MGNFPFESQGHLSLPDLPPHCAQPMGINKNKKKIKNEKILRRGPPRGRHDDDDGDEMEKVRAQLHIPRLESGGRAADGMMKLTTTTSKVGACKGQIAPHCALLYT